MCRKKLSIPFIYLKLRFLCVHALRACWRSRNTVTSINVTESIVSIFGVTRVSLSVLEKEEEGSWRDQCGIQHIGRY